MNRCWYMTVDWKNRWRCSIADWYTECVSLINCVDIVDSRIKGLMWIRQGSIVCCVFVKNLSLIWDIPLEWVMMARWMILFGKMMDLRVSMMEVGTVVTGLLTHVIRFFKLLYLQCHGVQSLLFSVLWGRRSRKIIGLKSVQNVSHWWRATV